VTPHLGILNVGAGDLKLSFDPANPAERIRAARVVTDMLRRGYALLVRMPDGKYTRATAFDEEACEYIVADFDPLNLQHVPQAELPPVTLKEKPDGQPQQAHEGPQPEAPAQRRGGRRKRVPAESVHTVAVARTAGG